MRILENISELLTLESALNKDGRHLLPEDLSILNNASVVFDNDNILWVGHTSQLPEQYSVITDRIDCSDLVVTPELVDSHTHIVFGGNRANEYKMRLDGADYQAIANAGGGILYTMNETNKASEQELFDLAVERINRIASYGIGTIEIKSGYSLTYDGELRESLIIDRLKKHFYPRVQIFNTFLAAHAVPKSFKSSSEYLRQVVIPLLKDLAPKNIIDAVDIFHESGYFDEKDTRELFDVAKSLNLAIKIHADEFNDNGGATIASNYQALSADHLLCTGDKGITDLANSSTVATVLPGTGFFLGKPQANAKKMLAAGCKLSIASDYNPGSCHFDNVLFVASLSAPMYPLNSAQLWTGITLNAAHALGLTDQGAIIAGKKPRFSFFNVKNVSEITYNWGRNFAVQKL
ncbi:imidazolonepropionase [Bacteriovorax sp. Seq25_V]|uniref:imidazolonepropionase n=1 Tax=Bacteriovorax sp. Seq25_V TaxID=1201288 RepID=UPI00038A4FA3|nr:imidazolonepropionase [Bacteriovorax sp. Seq25_V]EQC43540.1 imidazolonepropionase [Bacteriovorax sp. Seq25_V]